MSEMVWRSRVVSPLLATAGGVAAWLLWQWALPSVPGPLRAIVALAVFVIGPGAALADPLTRRVDAVERAIVPLGTGLVGAAALAHALGQLGATSLFPWVAAALTGVSIQRAIVRPPVSGRADRRTLIAVALIAILAAGAGTVAYAKRLSVTPDALIVNGSYDSYDSSYYAAMSAELATHIPPEAPFWTGHRLDYSYHPQLVLAMVYRFGGVPLLDLYFRYAWPTFLIMTGLTAFIFIRRIAGTSVALLATCLLLFGSDLSYIAAFFFRDRPYWDDLLWSTNWMAPGAELLFFNPWTPALCVMFLGLWSLVHAEEADGRASLIAACACFGSLVQFKPFGYAVVLGALAMTAVAGALDSKARRRLLLVLAGSIAVSVPYLVSVLSHYDDSQSVLLVGVGYATVLPDVVMKQLGLGTVLGPIATTLGIGWPAPAFAMLGANVVFFVGGLGLRWLGVPAVCRALVAQNEPPIWCLMAWMIVAAVLSPVVLMTHPYHQTFQFFHVALFVLWIFVARAVFAWGCGHPARQIAIVAVVILCAIPSTLHYLNVKWHDDQHPFAGLGDDADAVVESLRQTDPDRTVVMQRYPDRPSLITLLAERRSLLAWARYARDSGPLKADIDAFFASSTGDPGRSWSLLTRNHVTHVLETVGGDRIHPDVLRSLHPILVTPTYRLYAVPAQTDMPLDEPGIQAGQRAGQLRRPTSERMEQVSGRPSEMSTPRGAGQGDTAPSEAEPTAAVTWWF